MQNLFALPGSGDESTADEAFDTLLAKADFRVERIVSRGHVSPAGFWYDQEQAEWVLVVQGAARLRLQTADRREDIVELRAGDSLNIPAHQRHRVDWTSPDKPTIWLAIHYAD